MADNELTHVRAPEQITITVIRGRDLRGVRGDTINAMVKVEFQDRILGESTKEDCTPDAPAEFNYNTTLNVTFEDPLAIDEISCKPIVLTVVEILPKEKKQREEKTTVLGQCTLDLLPVIKGEMKHRVTLAVHATPGSPLEQLLPDQPRPGLDVLVSVNDPILSELQIKETNLMNLTVESLYSPPESWNIQHAAQYIFTAATPMPLSTEKENCVVFAGGQIKPSPDKEPPNKQKKWAMPGIAQGNAVYIHDKMLADDNIEDEDGDFRSKDDRDHRYISEQEKMRVSWNLERRSFLDQSATKLFQEKIAKSRYWPLEIYRTAIPSGGKGKKEEEGHISFHGIAYLNLAPLLYPGVQRIHGAYKVYAFTEHDMHEKTGRKGSLAEESMRIANGILMRSTSSPYPKPTGKAKDEAKGKDQKKGPVAKLRAESSHMVPIRQPSRAASVMKREAPLYSYGTGGELKPIAEKGKSKEKHDKDEKDKGEKGSSMKASDGASDGGEPVVNVEGQMYVDSKSYVMVEICLNRPLVPKRQPEELAKKVAEYIPPRPLFPKRTDGAQRAVEDYHNQIGNVANMVLEELGEHFGDLYHAEDETNISHDTMEERRQKLIYHLNASGKYFAFKEQLKHAVVKIVREKYLKTANFANKDELQAFLSELYVYLVDQMHVGLNKVLSVEDQAPVPEPLTDSAQLKHFAREAEVNENYELATKYYQERIARDRNDPDHWLDYGIFSLYINDLTKAEECFKECVSIDQRHLQGLLLYGVVCTMQDKHDAAETFFEAATSLDPKSILAWTMLGLFYDGTGNDIGTEMALIEANKLNMANALAELKALKEAEEQKIREEREKAEAERREVATAAEILHEEAGREHNIDTGQAEGAGSKNMTAPTAPTPTSLTGSDTKSKRRGSVRKSGNLKKSTENLASRPGSVRAKSPSGVPDIPEEPPASRQDLFAVPSQTIFMQTVEFLLEVKAMPFTERALAHHLLDDYGGPSAQYHIALARLKLQKRILGEAEESLKEALQFDHQNPDAWAILGHVKYMMGDSEVAKDCYERTLSFVADASEMHSIYLRLASIYLQEEQFEKAKRQFLMACKKSPSCVSWLGVGISCYRLGELSEAEDALSEANVLNNTDSEVWAYLSLVCLKTARQVEAEQAYKYAVKLHLQDEHLLKEIEVTQEEVGFGNPQL